MTPTDSPDGWPTDDTNSPPDPTATGPTGTGGIGPNGTGPSDPNPNGTDPGELNPADIAALIPFAATVGIVFDAVRTDPAGRPTVEAHLDHDPRLSTSGGTMHGGALMTLADSAGATCAFLNLPPDSATTTVNSMTNFLRGVRSGSVRAVSKPLHVGRTLIVVETDLLDDDGRTVARVTQTQAVRPLTN